MKKLLLPTFLIAAMLTRAAHAQSASDQVAQQFREYCLGDSTDHGERLLDDVELPKTSTSQATALADKIQADGSWPDINYAGKDRSAWEPYAHLTRVLSLTLYASRNPHTKEAAKCMAAVHAALAYWAQHDYRCPNWWYNIIGVPKILGTVGILLDKDLPNEGLKYITETVMPRAKLGTMTGQNKVWIAGNNVMLAVLTHDDALLQKASALIAVEIEIASQGVEGIQIDDSFHQHGPQQQFGNYGLAFAVDMTRWAVVLRETPAAIPERKISILRDYLLNGESRTLFQDAMDISACGRQIAPRSPIVKASTVSAVLATMKIVDPANATAYKEAPDKTGPVYFFRSDYLLNRTAEQFVSLKMRSTRVIGSETVNSENLSSRHLADGATYFYQSGKEYTDIFPAWNWNYIPGTTSLDQKQPLDWPKKKKAKADAADAPSADPADNETDPSKIPKATLAPFNDLARGNIFVGGLSTGPFAAAAMDFSTFDSADLVAHKAWFFAGNLTICLGAGITSTVDVPCVTTINQSLLHGPLAFSPTSKFATGEKTFKDVASLTHDNWRYIFPTPTTVTLRTGPVTGNWKSVFNTHSTPAADVKLDTFTLFIPHGNKPTDATYSYIVAPIKEKYEKRVEILSNTKTLQAVRIDNKMIGVIFWTAGKLKIGDDTLAADYPCIAAVDITDPKTPHFFLSDPSQKLPTITLTLDGVAHKGVPPTGTAAGKMIELK